MGPKKTLEPLQHLNLFSLTCPQFFNKEKEGFVQDMKNAKHLSSIWTYPNGAYQAWTVYTIQSLHLLLLLFLLSTICKMLCFIKDVLCVYVSIIMYVMFNLSFSASANCEAIPSTPEEGGRDQCFPPHWIQQSCCHQYFIRHGLNSKNTQHSL